MRPRMLLANFAAISTISVLVLPTVVVIMSSLFGSFYPSLWDEKLLLKGSGVLSNLGARNALAQSFQLAVSTSMIATLVAFYILAYRRVGREKGLKGCQTLLTVIEFLPLSYPDVLWVLGFYVMAKWNFVSFGYGLVFSVHLAFNLALAFFVLSPFVLRFSSEKILSAFDLGASARAVVWRVIYGELRLALVICVALTFAFSFDDYVLTYMLGGSEVQTVPIYVSNRMRFGASKEVIGLAGIMAAIGFFSIILLYAIESRRQRH